MRDGAWWFTVRWHHYRPIPIRFPQVLTAYSVNLWESDVAMFELVSAEEEQAMDRVNQEVLPSPNLAPQPQLRTGSSA